MHLANFVFDATHETTSQLRVILSTSNCLEMEIRPCFISQFRSKNIFTWWSSSSAHRFPVASCTRFIVKQCWPPSCPLAPVAAWLHHLASRPSSQPLFVSHAPSPSQLMRGLFSLRSPNDRIPWSSGATAHLAGSSVHKSTQWRHHSLVSTCCHYPSHHCTLRA